MKTVNFPSVHCKTGIDVTFKELPKEFKDKWVAALRSKTYPQTKKSLIRAGSFCCLGVACMIAGFEFPEELVNSDFLFQLENKKELPKELTENKELQERLASMNDNGKTFSEIADFIETNL
jgi:hypothetical protein